MRCPNCQEDTINFIIEVDNHYGADADGRRGERVVFAEFDSQDCDCELTCDQMDKLEKEAVEDYY